MLSVFVFIFQFLRRSSLLGLEPIQLSFLSFFFFDQRQRMV